MFSEITYGEILGRMLDRVPETMDKREGSVVYDALAPAAAELMQMYIEMDVIIGESFATTASHPYLVRRAAEFGLAPDQATYAVMRGEFNMDVPLGSRFNLEDLNYAAIEKIEDGIYKMRCETEGKIGSSCLGNLIPIDYINGLTKAELTGIITLGMDAEDTEHFRQQFLFRVQTPATSGNAYHFQQWALEVQGVGKARVVPTWNGPGTVKVILIDTDLQPASQALLDTAFAHIEEVRPIGAEVTVVAPDAKEISVSVTAKLTTGVYLADVKKNFTDRVKDYFKSITFVNNYVSYAIIGSLLLDVPGVLDYSGLKLNGSEANIKIEDSEVPVLGTVEVAI